jgi:hypothetical protein
VAPSVDQCRPYIEKAINELKTGEAVQTDSGKVVRLILSEWWNKMFQVL